jgi:LemA protein
MKKTIVIPAVLIGLIILYCIFGYNNLVNSQESVDQQWAQVETVYQRRLDLIPNLVATVKGYATHEKNTLLAVTKARALATQTKTENIIENPQQFKNYMAAQRQLSSSLGRLLVVVERYPDLKASQNFLALQNQLEGTENRISVERHRYNEVAKQFNTQIRQFPRVVLADIFHFSHKPYFEAETNAQKAPVVKF